MNDGIIDELEEPYFDIYQQEFYMHCYSLLSRERNLYQESKEGFTYIPVKLEDKVTRLCLLFMPETEFPNWSTKIRRASKKIKMSELDEFDTDYIDIDTLLGMYIDEYKQHKRETAKRIQKQFMKIQKHSAQEMSDEAA
jgi:hypothetical protein